MQDKKKTKHIKVRDLKPKKDVKGGIMVVTTSTKNAGHGVAGPGHGVTRPGNPNT
jgi:hypothetical protein